MQIVKPVQQQQNLSELDELKKANLIESQWKTWNTDNVWKWITPA